MLWACLIFPSLPLDVFARAQAPADAAHPFVVSSGGHYPRVIAANAAALTEIRARAGSELGATSLRLRVTGHVTDRTLRDDEVAQWAAQITKALEALGGVQRA